MLGTLAVDTHVLRPIWRPAKWDCDGIWVRLGVHGTAICDFPIACLCFQEVLFEFGFGVDWVLGVAR